MTTLIIAPPPTPNGDLHVGHLAGPYLAGDVYARMLRGEGQGVLYATGTDDSQTYVVTSAAKLNLTPEALCAQAARDIQDTLKLTGVQVDGFAPFDERYRATVLAFLTPLFEQGKFEWRTVTFPYDPVRQEFLVEGLVGGTCPVCLSGSRGGLCEACGHPNNFMELLDPVSTLHPRHPVEGREARILVFPLERYRAQLEAYYARQEGRWRPHILQLVRELLAAPLPDFPVTYPVTWGIPSPFAGTEGQVLNAWVEGMPASMYCSATAGEAGGLSPEQAAALWEDPQARLVYFLGFDNSYFWGVVHLALLMAHGGRFVLPDVIVPNEFYELEHEKFSTSRGHLIWARDLTRDVPRDLARYYLALTCPEHHRTNFSRSALEKLTRERLLVPWAGLQRHFVPDGTGPLPVTPAGQDAARRMAERLRACYALETFSLTRLADTLTQHLQRLHREADEARAQGHAPSGDLWHQLRVLLHLASPLLIDATASLLLDQQQPWTALLDESSVTPFALPPLVPEPALA